MQTLCGKEYVPRGRGGVPSAEWRESEDGAGHYGVCVECGMESVSIADITSSQSRILDLLTALVECGVTPVCLRDVVEDWLLV